MTGGPIASSEQCQLRCGGNRPMIVNRNGLDMTFLFRIMKTWLDADAGRSQPAPPHLTLRAWG